MTSNALTSAEIKLYHNISSFAAKNKIQLINFWRTSRLCLTTEQFLLMLLNIGYEYTMEEMEQLQQAEVEFFNIEGVIKNVDVWRNSEGTVSDFISKQVNYEEEQQKIRSKKRNKDSKLDTLSSFGVSQGGKSRATQRLWKKEVSLNQTLIRTKNQSDYQLTLKVGEANDICKKLQNDRNFLIEAAANKVKIIQCNRKSGKQQEIKVKQFERVYEKLKQESLAKGMEFEGTIEQDLKKVLVQVMYLSSELEQQIKLLQQKGVTH